MLTWAIVWLASRTRVDHAFLLIALILDAMIAMGILFAAYKILC